MFEFWVLLPWKIHRTHIKYKAKYKYFQFNAILWWKTYPKGRPRMSQWATSLTDCCKMFWVLFKCCSFLTTNSIFVVWCLHACRSWHTTDHDLLLCFLDKSETCVFFILNLIIIFHVYMVIINSKKQVYLILLFSR